MMIRHTVRIGRLVRKEFRVVLDHLNAEWKEHKGLLGSHFVITGTDAQWAQIQKWITWSNGE